jgi:hypothetical protein
MLAAIALVLSTISPLGYPAETQVLLADGTLRPISEVRVGDLVRSTDPGSDEDSAGRVTWTFTSPEDQFVEVTVASGSSLLASRETAFWVEDVEEWVDAHDLRAGQSLHDTAGARVRITDVRQRTVEKVAHYLNVEDVPTYYVTVGDQQVLVHHF